MGIRLTSGEHLVSLQNGQVVKTRSIQPFPQEQLWNSDYVDALVGVPWDPVGTIQRGAHENQEPQKPEPEIDGDALEAPIKSRGMYVMPKHLEKFGYSEKCLTCRKCNEEV